MDIQEEQRARKGHKRILGQRLIDGEPLVSLVQEFPEMIFGYKKLKQDLNEYRLDIVRQKPTVRSYQIFDMN